MNDSTTSRLTEAMVRAAATIDAPGGTEQRLEAIVHTAIGTVPGFDEASISVSAGDARIVTHAASSDLVKNLDAHQYQTKEGPCFQALTTHGVVSVPSVRHEQRWPAYIPRAAQAGVTTQLAVHIGDGGPVRGALNLYGTTDEGIDPEAPGIAVMFASHAASALGWAHTEEHLNAAITSRKMIGQAIGIVMERYQIDEGKAFEFLARVSQTENIKLRDVAQELVTQTQTRYSSHDD